MATLTGRFVSIPDDAAKRDIKDGDIVKTFNDRGGCWRRYRHRAIRPGTVHSFQAGAKYDPLEPGKPGSIDRGGVMNLLTPARWVAKMPPAMANNSCLVEICKWEA